MPNLSKRAHEMPASPIRKLAPFAVEAKKRGTKVYHLNIGQPDIESPKEFWDAVKNAPVKVLEYSPSQGMLHVVDKVAEHYCKQGIEITPAQVMLTTAGSEAILFALMVCMNPGDEVIVPEPMYANYISFAMTAGVKVIPITTHIENDFALPSVEDFAAVITPNTKGIIVCNPSNPTGTVYSQDQLLALRELALKHDLYIIADEVYREFNYTGKPVPSVMQLEGLEKHAIMVDSVSKRYSLCGARLGFLVSRNSDVMASALKYAQARLSPPTLEQYGLLGALTTPQEYFDNVREEYQARRDIVMKRLRAMDGTLCPDIKGAFYATVRLPVDDSDVFCQWLLEKFNHNGATVMLAPATGFYATKGLGKDEVRVAYVLNCDDLNAAMDCLHVALSQYPGRTCEQVALLAAK